MIMQSPDTNTMTEPTDEIWDDLWHLWVAFECAETPVVSAAMQQLIRTHQSWEDDQAILLGLLLSYLEANATPSLEVQARLFVALKPAGGDAGLRDSARRLLRGVRLHDTHNRLLELVVKKDVGAATFHYANLALGSVPRSDVPEQI